MKEITRIHIAKVPYDIEFAAKKDIEKYIKALELYAEDDELLQDIEIRITELLSDRGVPINGVITVDDVVAIRKQLGEPEEFMGDEKRAKPVVEVSYTNAERKLFRDKDNAVLGGVLSGCANYFGVNPLWLRLIFIATLFFSAGTVLLAYLLLWVIIPPAKTAAEKLQMCGKPVNLDSIRELNESGQNLASERERATAVRRVIMIIIGVISIGISVTTLMFTIFAAFGIYHYNVFGGIVPGAQWAFVVAYILAIISGVLLSTLFAVVAYIAFTLNMNKRIIISVVVIVVAGLLSFGTAVGLVSYQSMRADSQIQRTVKDSSISVPAGFSSIKKISVDAKSVQIKYVVDNNNRIVYHSLPGDEQPNISYDGTNLSVKLQPNLSARWPHLQPTLTIYGPKLDLIEVKYGNVVYSAIKQDLAIFTTGQNSSINLSGGMFNNLAIDARDNSSVSADESTVENVIINSQTDSDIELGTVKSLDVTQPEACPSNTSAEVDLQSVSAGTMLYNGKEIKAGTYDATCGSITFDGKN